MTDARNRSAEDIERELERRRSEIDRTVSAIQDRLTPEAAFDHALAYMRGSGGQRVLDAVRRNVYPGPGTPEEMPQVPDPDVGTPPPEQMPMPGPDMVPPPAPSPGGPPVMAAAKLVLLAGLVVAGLAPRSTWAQTEQSPLSQTTPPEVQDGRPVDTPEDGGGSLSEELSQSEGVIAPSPEAATTDPGIIQPTPDAGAGTMRVIPPPGSSGGDPNVRPQ